MGELAIDPVATSADLHFCQENCESNCALQCLMLAADTDMSTIGDMYDQRSLSVFLIVHPHTGMLHRSVPACPKLAIFGERWSAGKIVWRGFHQLYWNLIHVEQSPYQSMRFHPNILLPLPIISLLMQHFSLKTRNICLTFFSGIPLHSKILRTE